MMARWWRLKVGRRNSQCSTRTYGGTLYIHTSTNKYTPSIIVTWTILLKTTHQSYIVTYVAHTWGYQAFFYYIIIILTRGRSPITSSPLPPSFLFPIDFSPTPFQITVFGDFRHPSPNFSSHQLFSRFPAYFSIGRGCRLGPPLQTGSLRIRCSLPQVSLSKLTFSPLRASPSLPPHPVPVWMVENFPTVPRR